MKTILTIISALTLLSQIKAQDTFSTVRLTYFMDQLRFETPGQNRYWFMSKTQTDNKAFALYSPEDGGFFTYWKEGSGDLIVNKGKVGVGTSDPLTTLDVDGSFRAGNISTYGSTYTRFQLAEHSWSGSHAVLFNAYKSISVNGSLLSTGNTKYANDAGSYGGGAGGIFFNGNGGAMHFRISPTSTGKDNNIDWGISKMVINRNGDVGIGTNDPNGWKLAVKGKIRAEEIKVETGWADFVFENDYNLRTLEEVEQHINEKGHLPEIPSENEVNVNGINLGEMNSKLLMKIEELTLYMIDINKQMQQLRLENQELKEKINYLETK